MKGIRTQHVIAWLLLMVMGLIVIHAPFTVFVGSQWPAVGDAVKAWKELLMLAATVLLVIECTRLGCWRRLTADKLLWLILGYGALHIVVALVAGLPHDATIAGLLIDLRFVAYFTLVYVFLRLYPPYYGAFLRVALLGAVIVIGFAALQQVLPKDFLGHLGYSKATISPYLTVDENPDFVRHSSTLRGPNPLGAYAVMVLAAVVAFGLSVVRKIKDNRLKYLHLFMALGALVALWTSHSRSAWLAAIAALVIVFGAWNWRKVSPNVLAGMGAVVLLAAGGLYVARDSYFVHNVILHDNPTTGAAVDSNAGHLESLIHGTEKLLSSPLGSGVGSTGSASLHGPSPLIIENQYLFVAHEVGWLGLGLFVAIFSVVMLRLWRLRSNWMALAAVASGAGLAIIGILLPVWVDDTVSIVWWGMAAIILAKEDENYGTAANKKAKRTT